MAMKFTDDQQRVIDLKNCNILVSAAAGSGKTAVLVERIVQMICDAEKGTDIDRLLVVTFTNAAAAQMRERITKVLTARVEDEPDNLHLQRQLMLIHNAQITTIHSFCLYLIRNHFNDIGLDPDFRTADDGEMKLLCEDVLAQLMEEAFLEARPAFLNCVESFAAGGKEKRLEELILGLYEYAMSYPWPESWLEEHRSDYDIRDAAELAETPWYRDLTAMASMLIKEGLQITEESLRICEKAGGPYMYASALESDRALLESLADSVNDPEIMYAKLHPLSFMRLAAKKDISVSEELKEQVKKKRERVKTLTGDLADKFFYAAPVVWAEDMQKAGLALKELIDLTLAFKKRLDAIKREKNLLDFHDMEHMALKILLRLEDGRIVPTATALDYREHFSEILIDEYQDSNLVQEFLLQSISGEEDGIFNRFMVGDVKQSIYKFRLARPELFLEKFDAYKKEDGDCVRVDLKKNFRSRKEVTDCVNELFSCLMHRELGGVEYDADAALDPAAVYPEPEAEDKDAAPGAAVYEPELLVVPMMQEGLDEQHQEAMAVAAKIKSLVGKMPVRDEKTGGLRPARFGDIVILLRATAGWDEAFSEVLTQQQIPVHVTSKTGYFAAGEVQNVLNFLRVLNNPLQDIPLFGVLHSPIGDFTDAQIAVIRSMDDTGKRKLYDCLVMASEGEDTMLAQSCREFLDLIGRYRRMAVYLPIHNLLECFLEEIGYLYTVTAMPGGQQRRLNVEMLLAKAESYEKTSYSGLFHFVRYMEQLEKYDVDFGAAGAMDENADIVRIMSIHKSKGLEFPICFVSGLSKNFNRKDGAGTVIWDMDLGLACDCIDPEKRTKKTTIKKTVLSRKLRMDSLGEELRVLYVAMTRPQEKLILTAGCKEENLPDTAADDAAILPVTAAHLMEGSSFYDWILPVWQRSGRKIVIMDELSEAAMEGQDLAHRYQKQERLKIYTADETHPEIEALQERIGQGYAHQELEDLFVKTTVSELKKAGMHEEAEAGAELFPEEEVIPYLPRFVQEQEETIGATVRGSAYHRVLELFPFSEKQKMAEWTKGEVACQIECQRESGALKEEYARAVNPGKILSFLHSDLAQRMSRAAHRGLLHCEQPFVLGLSANRIKPELPETETVLIQGIIDVFFEEEDGLVLADYKTDRVDTAAELVSRYKVQLDYYEQALTQLTGKKVKERIIYSFALREEIPV